jgi:hypothetical protein
MVSQSSAVGLERHSARQRPTHQRLRMHHLSPHSSHSLKLMIKREQIAEHGRDSDGYWIALKNGWQDAENPQYHTIVEDTRERAFDHRAIPCHCRECLNFNKDDCDHDWTRIGLPFCTWCGIKKKDWERLA